MNNFLNFFETCNENFGLQKAKKCVFLNVGGSRRGLWRKKCKICFYGEKNSKNTIVRSLKEIFLSMPCQPL